MDQRKGSNGFFTYILLGVVIGTLSCLIAQDLMVKRQPKVIAKSKFDEVMYYINNMYVDTVKVAELEEEAIVAMMDELDPHSQYISLEEFNVVNDPLLGSFDGIGVQFRIVEDTIAIVNTIKGGPSEKVGIMAG
ncbi:MAG: peptidase S41, partial [Bacteroidales bacterium]|nr:peptidase S41 [Bacteroidales bacterium]